MVNLPRRDKMIEPRYQEIKSSVQPTAETADGKVRVKVIPGESLGKRATVETRTPIAFLHYTLKPGGSISQPLKKNFNAFAYVVGGSGSFGREGNLLGKVRSWFLKKMVTPFRCGFLTTQLPNSTYC